MTSLAIQNRAFTAIAMNLNIGAPVVNRIVAFVLNYPVISDWRILGSSPGTTGPDEM